MSRKCAEFRNCEVVLQAFLWYQITYCTLPCYNRNVKRTCFSVDVWFHLCTKVRSGVAKCWHNTSLKFRICFPKQTVLFKVVKMNVLLMNTWAVVVTLNTLDVDSKEPIAVFGQCQVSAASFFWHSLRVHSWSSKAAKFIIFLVRFAVTFEFLK